MSNLTSSGLLFHLNKLSFSARISVVGQFASCVSRLAYNAYMSRNLWILLAITEILLAASVLVLEWPFLLIALKVIVTAFIRRDVFQPNAAYFIGMFCGCAIRLAPVPLLAGHALWITRKRIPQTTLSN